MKTFRSICSYCDPCLNFLKMSFGIILKSLMLFLFSDLGEPKKAVSTWTKTVSKIVVSNPEPYRLTQVAPLLGWAETKFVLPI